ncbi:hypothetical protein CAOG_02242 [Capsaspora owczarzaki ATCC 30864]|uniref:Protein MON2 homolog n=1 Tax=Capsaspora owczarzaki (strain ATCC 30864) TaxID=595528 RepID=A0A0D2VLP0_CAPO3|nr:hypothetical protein CAOG_02242 [Capsaspora owczarzaki ATCC 30864]KJE91042.1 hypothetical protein CAOG_002242 [Capsaspora owczarzaki ATCC 30864]|eukprot:XP_004348992.1 hypothetical protein CAOG_02242 [Capsaspora owczarzaki ATCC 30864]
MSATLGRQLLEVLQTDLRTISAEAKKKHPTVKDAAEHGILRLRSVASASSSSKPFNEVLAETDEVLAPLLMACDSKAPKLVQVAINSVHKLISHNAISQSMVGPVINTLWQLMEESLEEVKILQCCLSFITSSLLLHDETLSKVIVVCFRLYFKKDALTTNTAAATLRQILTVVFDRVTLEDTSPEVTSHLKPTSTIATTLALGNDSDSDTGGAAKNRRVLKALGPCALDAYLLFNDLCRLTNGDVPQWLVGVVEMSRTFGLELIESSLSNHPELFLKHEALSFLLKEKVCPLVIKLFSSGMKYHNNAAADRASFPVSTRLLKLVLILVQRFYNLLVTESEIFLSMLVKFLDPDKPMWQRAVALEVMRGLVQHPDMLMAICEHYDMQPQATQVLRNMVAGIANFITTLLANAAAGLSEQLGAFPPGVYAGSGGLTPPLGPSVVASSGTTGGALSSSTAMAVIGAGAGGPLKPQLAESTKNLCLESGDKTEAPVVSETYALSIGLACMITLIESLSAIVTTHWALRNSQGDKKAMWSLPSSAHTPTATTAVVDANGLAGDESLMRDLKRTMEEIRTDAQFPVWRELVESTWGAILQSLAQLLQSSRDDDVTQAIMRSYQTYTNLCGALDMKPPRDAFLVSLCKFSLPFNYDPRIEPPPIHAQASFSHVGVGSLTLSSASGVSPGVGSAMSSTNSGGVGGGGSSGGATAPTGGNAGDKDAKNAPVGNGWVLNSMNIAAIRAVLYIVHCLGDLLGESWSIALETLMHLDSIVGGSETSLALLASSNRRITDNRLNLSSSATAQSGVSQSELSVLATMLSSLFESSCYLDDSAVRALVNALCLIGHEPIGSPLSMLVSGSVSKETSSSSLLTSSTPSSKLRDLHRHANAFVTCRMWELGSVNLHRVGVFWPLIERYLVEAADNSDQVVREYAVDVLTRLAHSALAFEQRPTPLVDDLVLQETILSSLLQISPLTHADVRTKQLECLLLILHSCGQSLSRAWTIVLAIAGAATRVSDEDLDGSTAGLGGLASASTGSGSANLIKLAFQSVSLIVGDFLGNLPVECLVLCIDTVGRFGLQLADMNISLTAVGLLWSIADYLQIQRASIEAQLGASAVVAASSQDQSAGLQSGITSLDALWMALFGRLADICIDPRPEVRKSASQTLFSTISTHGALLGRSTWHACLWDVIFPLLAHIQTSSTNAAQNGAAAPAEGSIMVHHSRNTASKQWDETKVIALNGAAQLFSTHTQKLAAFDDFPSAWSTLLEAIERTAVEGSKEVATAAIESLQEILKPPATDDSSSATPPDPEDATATTIPDNVWRGLYLKAWVSWLSIGSAVTALPESGTGKNGAVASPDLYSQQYLQMYVETFSFVHSRIKAMFSIADARELFSVLTKVLLYPNSNAYRDADNTSTLQNTVLEVFARLEPTNPDLWPIMVVELLNYVPLAWLPLAAAPPSTQSPAMQATLDAAIQAVQSLPAMPANVPGIGLAPFLPLARKCLVIVGELYEKHATLPSMLQQNIFSRIMKVLHHPLALKYACPSQSLWRLAVNCFISVVRRGLKLQRPSLLGADAVNAMWAEMLKIVQDFWFSDSVLPKDYTLEQRELDEDVDLSVLELVKADVFPFTDNVSPATLALLMESLRRGSEPGLTAAVADGASGLAGLNALSVPRERLTKACFDALLMTSFSDSPGKGVSDVAVLALTTRCKDVLVQYVSAEGISGSMPLPRALLGEVAFVLKAIVTLINSLQQDARSDKLTEGRARQILIQLYPVLVDCVATSDANIRVLLRDVLLRIGTALMVTA